MSKRVYALDFLRAFMMFLGILLHGLTFNPQLDSLSKLWNERLFSFLAEIIHTFRMPLFFCLSGFFCALMLDKLGWRRFLINRGLRIGLPFVFSLFTIGFATNVFYHTLALLKAGYNLSNALAAGVSLHNFQPHDFRPIHLWFLYYLLACIPLMVLLHYTVGSLVSRQRMRLFLRKYGWLKNRVTALTLLAVFPTLYLFFTNNNGNPTPTTFVPSLTCLVPYFYYYAIGWLLFSLRLNMGYFVIHSEKLLVLAVLFTVARVLVWALLPKCFLLVVAFYNLSLAAFIFGFLGIVQRYFNRSSVTLQYFSDASYWIYLIHLPIIVFLKIFFFQAVSLSVFLLLLAITVCLCLLSYNYLIRPTRAGKLLNGKILEPYPVHKLPFLKMPLSRYGRNWRLAKNPF